MSFEKVTCTRCGGTGHYSYCQRYGTRCFKCGGAGTTYTKRGSLALNFYTDSLKVRAGDIRPGDLVCSQGANPKFHRVVEAGYHVSSSRWRADNDQWQPFFTLACDDYHMHFHSDSAMVLKGWTTEEKQAKLKAALEFQDSLTKLGKPRKRPLATSA